MSVCCQLQSGNVQVCAQPDAKYKLYETFTSSHSATATIPNSYDVR